MTTRVEVALGIQGAIPAGTDQAQLRTPFRSQVNGQDVVPLVATASAGTFSLGWTCSR